MRVKEEKTINQRNYHANGPGDWGTLIKLKEVQKNMVDWLFYETHRAVLLFCFLGVIQYELSGLIIIWNRRHVRQSSVRAAGKPDILFWYYLPTTVGYEHQGILVDKNDRTVATEIIGITQPPIPRNKNIFDLLECYVYLNNIAVDSSAESALDVYVKLIIGFLHDDRIVF